MRIQIFPLFYKEEGKKIGIRPYPDIDVREKLKMCGALKYSKTYRTWYLPYEKEVFVKLQSYFTDLEIIESNAPIRTEPVVQQTDIANIQPLQPLQVLEETEKRLNLYKIRA